MGSPFLGFSVSGGIVISNIAVVRDSYYATITWTTSVATTSKVEYGTTTGYLETPVTNASLVTSHSVMINRAGSGLVQNQLYHYRVGNIAATSVSTDQNFTTVRLAQMQIQAFAGLSPAFIDALADGTSGQKQNLIGSPYSFKNLDVNAGSVFSDAINGYVNIWLWGNRVSLNCGSTITANGGNGGDAANACCAAFSGGNGGNGSSGGGGGGAGPFQSGGAGGTFGGSGDGGTIPCCCLGIYTAGSGGFGYAFEGWDGGSALGGLSPLDGGSGSGTGCSPSDAAGGGGGAGGMVAGIINELVSCSGGFMSAQGGTGGSGFACNPGNPGNPGYVVIYTRKYDGTLVDAGGVPIFIVPVIKAPGANSYTYGSYITNNPCGPGALTDTWDYLYQP